MCPWRGAKRASSHQRPVNTIPPKAPTHLGEEKYRAKPEGVGYQRKVGALNLHQGIPEGCT